jgi:hypothetical protein
MGSRLARLSAQVLAAHLDCEHFTFHTTFPKSVQVIDDPKHGASASSGWAPVAAMQIERLPCDHARRVPFVLGVLIKEPCLQP